MLDAVSFGEGDFFVDAVDGGGAGEDEAGDAGGLSGFEEVEGAVDVGGEVEGGVLDGGANAGAGGEVDDGVEGSFGEEAVDGGAVAEVAFDDAGVVLEGGDVGALDGGVVVVVEFIEHGDVGTLGEEALDGVRANKSGPTGNEDIDHVAVPKLSGLGGSRGKPGGGWGGGRRGIFS